LIKSIGRCCVKPFSAAKIAPARQLQSLRALNRRFKFYKRSQLFLGPHNETLSVAAMRVSNEGCSTARIQKTL